MTFAAELYRSTSSHSVEAAVLNAEKTGHMFIRILRDGSPTPDKRPCRGSGLARASKEDIEPVMRHHPRLIACSLTTWEYNTLS